MNPIAQELIVELDKARAAMQAVVDTIDPEQPIYDSWKLKEIVDHISGWDDAAIAAIRSFVLSEEQPTPALKGIDHYNAHSVETREALSLDHSLREWAHNREMLKQVVAKVPAEKFGIAFHMPWQAHASIEQLIQILIDHEAEHAEEIEKLAVHS